MGFLETEAANGVRVAECVTFTRGSGATARAWRYTTADQDVTVDGVTFRAAVWTRDAIRRTRETGKSTVTITCAHATQMVTDWLAAAVGPGAEPDAVREGAPVTAVRILRVHLSDAGVVIDRAAVFQGMVAGLQTDGTTATIPCDGLQALFARQLPRLAIQKTCPWAFGDLRCGVDPLSMAVAATVDALGTAEQAADGGARATLTLDLDALPTRPSGEGTADDTTYWDGGALHFAVDGVPTRTYIERADVSDFPTVTLTLYAALPAALVGTTVHLTAGCDKTFASCLHRFANTRRFGGYPFLPERNPLIEGAY
ncbi:baseplate hub protein [Roseisolibacter agri]|uniref:Bacteriophage phiJL001 Gp84 C-terminal domain-containing protein n=1 Tax=Roseisolibacter agri TaxID=2014610 RepID=A0AA37Q296_9BACT|nr:DUF2163 domain-containing protein [Roseisolibacter agri]GLC25059.1 hypothetical protein rosag_15720 [Roseisolibacter agri]